jgi:molybdate transport system substrate-binding protein
VDELARKNLLVPGSRAVYAVGSLVLWVPPGSPAQVSTLTDVAAPEIQFVSMAKPESAPYGAAAVEALRRLGLWSTVQPRVVYAENVAMAKQFAVTRNADAAFTAQSLVLREGGRTIPVEEQLHAPIEQAMGILKSSPHQALAARFCDFVLHGPGRQILLKNGYR